MGQTGNLYEQVMQSNRISDKTKAAFSAGWNRMEFGRGELRCNNVIPIPGHKDTERSYTYCRKMLDKLDKDGKPRHDGLCSVQENEK